MILQPWILILNASNIFDVVLVGTGLFFNGNDAIEIVFDGNVIETFGVVGDNPDTNGWLLMSVGIEDSWAYQENGVWSYGAVNCTDGTLTTWDSTCVYPFAVGKQQ